MTTAQQDRLQGLVGSIAIKAPVKAASTGNLTLSGEQTVDGVALVDGDYCLVKNQTTTTENGIYVVSTGSWQRRQDFDGPLDVTKGTLVLVTDGTLGSNTMWRLTTSGVVTFGSTAITFANAAVTDSSTVSFIQSGVGAVQRTAQNKMRLVVDVNDFGADPTGAADSYAAFVAALAASDIVLVPPGTYKNATGAIAITGNKIIWGLSEGGQSNQVATINHTAAAGSCFTAISNEFGGVAIKGLRATGGNGSYFITSYRPQSRFESIHMENYVGGGIKLDSSAPGSWGSSIRNCKWNPPTAPANAYTGYYINVNGGDVELDHCTAIYGAIGCDIQQGEAVTLNRCSFNSQASPYSSAAASDTSNIRITNGANYHKAITIKNCYLEGGTNAVYVDECTGLTIDSNFMDNLGNGTNVIYLASVACKNVRIVGNNIRQRTAAGIAINVVSADQVDVLNNYVDADGAGGIWLKNTATAGAASTTVTIDNNTAAHGTLNDSLGYVQTLRKAIKQDLVLAAATWTNVYPISSVGMFRCTSFNGGTATDHCTDALLMYDGVASLVRYNQQYQATAAYVVSFRVNAGYIQVQQTSGGNLRCTVSVEKIY